MAKTAAEVNVGVDGVVWTAPVGSTAPTTASSSLNTPWADLGFVSEDGVTETIDATTDKIRAWQKAAVVRTVVSEGTVSWKLVLLQTNAATVALYHGGTVAGDGSIVLDPTKARPYFAFTLDVIDGNQRIRCYAPQAQVSEVGDLVYQNGEAIGYEITIEATYNDTLGGSAQKWYSSLTSNTVATITTALPATAATGQVITLVGTGFDSTSAVTVGGVTATYDAVGSTKLYVTIPSGTAGSAPIIVTNAGGASTAKAYTRG